MFLSKQHKKYVLLDKKLGETPRIVLDKFRHDHSWVGAMPLAYAGRLDPMAEGKLLVLIGNECKNQSAYHALDKEYEFEVLLGIKSDTGDILGLIDSRKIIGITDGQVQKAIKKIFGKQEFPYPVFSSKTVRGKPLFLWALENRLDEIEIPITHVNIYSIRYNGMYTINKKELQDAVIKKFAHIPKVTEESKALGADFRRGEIEERWINVLSAYEDTQMFQVARFTCVCSSGTYIRTLSEKIAMRIGTEGLAYRITRTRIGRYVPITQRLGFWLKTYNN
jgi:tRNA pseudouridine(55) synthase